MTWGCANWGVLLLVPAAALAGCAAAQAPRPDTIHEVRSLQADIDAQEVIASSGDCAERCRAVASICDSAGRICQVSSDLAEVEALASCRRAENVCIEVRRRVGEECDCP